MHDASEVPIRLYKCSRFGQFDDKKNFFLSLLKANTIAEKARCCMQQVYNKFLKTNERTVSPLNCCCCQQCLFANSANSYSFFVAAST